jgi:hypothetical protein
VIRYFVVPLSSRIIRFLPLVLLTSSLMAQAPLDVVMERAGYVDWLKKAPNSPLSAVAQQRIGDGLRLGPTDADIPLPGIDEYRVYPSGAGILLESSDGKRPLARGGPHRIGKYALYLTGPQPGTVLTVFGQQQRKAPPGHFEYDPSLVFSGPLLPPAKGGKVRVLAADGTETDATEAGSVIVPLGASTRLRVLRIASGGEESELEIFFRDQSNGQDTYPAGRFVNLIPLPNGHYRLDFNRARNPFCAYSAVYPCPAPWRGNVLPASIRAGERYAGGGLQAPPVRAEVQ